MLVFEQAVDRKVGRLLICSYLQAGIGGTLRKKTFDIRY